MNDEDLRDIVAEGFAAEGIGLEAAGRLAQFVADVSRVRAAGELHRLLQATRCTVPGEGLVRALDVAGNEPLRTAAARLKVSAGRLSKLVRAYRKNIEETGVLTSRRECNSNLESTGDNEPTE